MKIENSLLIISMLYADSVALDQPLVQVDLVIHISRMGHGNGAYSRLMGFSKIDADQIAQFGLDLHCLHSDKDRLSIALLLCLTV